MTFSLHTFLPVTWKWAFSRRGQTGQSECVLPALNNHSHYQNASLHTSTSVAFSLHSGFYTSSAKKSWERKRAREGRKERVGGERARWSDCQVQCFVIIVAAAVELNCSAGWLY